jgi:hypothetical protein
MRLMFLAVPALLLAGAAAAQQDGRLDPKDPRAKAPPVEYRSALEGYRPYEEPQPRDWRQSNEAVGSAGGHAGQRPSQGEAAQTSRPKPGAPAPRGHGDHK